MEIKFRAWKVSQGRMVDWRYLLSITYGKNKIQDPNIDDSIFNDPDFILMQFTGLYDKNGIEVYVGDILQDTYPDYGNLKYIVEMRFGAFIAKLLSSTEYRYCYYLEETEIIGNIYENPELLEV